jgi:hypothetical protein
VVFLLFKIKKIEEEGEGGPVVRKRYFFKGGWAHSAQASNTSGPRIGVRVLFFSSGGWALGAQAQFLVVCDIMSH